MKRISFKIKKRFCQYISLLLSFIFVIAECIFPFDFMKAKASDNSTITNFTISFEAGAELVGTEYPWKPDEDISGHQFVYRINYRFSGDGIILPNEISIVIPRHILKARGGVYADQCELSVPKLSDATGGNDFAYIESTNSLTITNINQISSTSEGYIDIAYTTNRTTFNYQDMVVSDAPTAEITLKNGSDILDTRSSTAVPVSMDTSAELLSVTKKASSKRYAEWDDEWGTKPDDADDYYYVIWTFVSEVSATQPYWFIIDENFDEPDSEIVGYKLSGRSRYSSANSGYYSYSFEGNRNDYVLTRHLKSSYTAEQYSQLNNAAVTVRPADEPENSTTLSSAAVFNYDRPQFVIPEHGYNAWKYGNTTWEEKFDSAWPVADYGLTEFISGERDDLSGNIKYYIDTIANPYPYTLSEEATPEDYEQYGKVNVTYTLVDDKVYFNDDITTEMEEITIPEGTQPLTYEDYEIDHITYNLEEKDAGFDYENMCFIPVDPVYNPEDILNIDGKFGESDEWVRIASYYPLTKSCNFDTNYIRSMTRSEIYFKENCTAYRITTTNKRYQTIIVSVPYYRIKRSPKVLEKIRTSRIGEEMSWLTNTGNYKVVRDGGTLLYNKDIIGRDYIIGYVVNSDMTKKVVSFSNSNADKIATISYKIDASESYLTNDGIQYVKQNSGTIFDLLPMGGEVDLSSVAVQNNGVIMNASAYDVTTTANYKNTGRTMLTVYIKEQFDSVSVTFDMIYSWESVIDYGTSVLNSAAYETGNESITNGFSDDGGTIAESSLLKNLDPDSDDKRFLYTSVGYNVDILTAANSGLTKSVKSAKDYIYSDKAVVHQNGDYSYKLRYSSSGGVTAENMIIFDSLENYSDDDVSGCWHGILQGIDLNQPLLAGAAPVLYYSSEENLDITLHHDLDEEIGGVRIWKNENEFGNIENARAFAIDLRKGQDGEDFIITENDSTVAIIYMKAPPSDDSGQEDPKTYNDIFASYTTTDELLHKEEIFTHHGYTEILFRIMADINIRKVSTEDNETPVKGVTFNLSGTSDYGTIIDQTLSTDVDGLISFTDIEKGSYLLSEIEGHKEFLPLDSAIVVVIDNDGSVTFNGDPVMSGVYHTIGNVPRLHADINFSKHDIATQQLAVTGARFELSGTSDYGNDVMLYAQSDSSGNVSFPNIELGTYTMRETNTASGYILGGNVYTVKVTGNERFSITVSQNEGDKAAEFISRDTKNAYTIYNEPYHSFTIQKQAYADNMPVTGAVFELKGTTLSGKHIELSRPTNARGLITFSDIESGTYTIQEIFAPYGFGLDPTIRTVTIDRKGNVNISDTEIDSSTLNFVFINKENGSITITKKWLDGLSNSQREENNTDAVIHLTTEKKERTSATFKNSTVGSQSVLLNNVVSPITKVTGFRQWEGDDEPVYELIANGTAKKIDNDRTPYSIYAWIVDDGTVYWWSDAMDVYITYDTRLFWNLSAAKNIDVSGINTSKMTSFANMFVNDSALTSIDLRSFDTSNVTAMNSMFSGCLNLVSANLRGFDTSRVTNMASMFSECRMLADLDIRSFDTRSVADMSYMFYNCRVLTDLDLSHFNTQELTNMSGMFRSCVALQDLDVSSFDTSAVTTMSETFRDCVLLKKIDVGNFDTSSCTNMYCLFYNCNSLLSLDVSNFDTSSCTNMCLMFYNCNKLTSLDVSGFDTSSCMNMQQMFQSCTSLPSLDLSSFDTSSCTTMYAMFYNCKGLTELDISSFDTSSCINMYQMFQDCKGLASLDVSGFDTSSCTNMANMFANCSSLSSLDLRSFNTSSVTTMSSMFSGCTSMENLYFSDQFDTSSVTTMGSMFYNCKSFTVIDVSSFDTSNVNDMNAMFQSCNLAENIIFGEKFDTSRVTTMANMFRYCYALTDFDVSVLDTSSVNTMNAMFANCTNLTRLTFGSRFNTSLVNNFDSMFASDANLISLDVSGFDTSSAVTMASMFSSCRLLDTIDVSNFDTSHVNFMNSMFSVCNAVSALDVSGFDTSSCTNMSSMFNGCSNLVSLDVSGFDTSHVLSFANMFNGCNHLLTLDISGFDTSHSTEMNSMFNRCDVLEEIHIGSGFDTSRVTTMSSMFAYCYKLKNIDVSAFDTSKVTSMDSMFLSCNSVTVLDVSGFDTSSCTTMSSMFNGCNRVTTLDVSGFDTSLVTSMSSMFSGCSSLAAVDVSGFNTSLVTSMSSMFNGCNEVTELDVTNFDTTTVTNMENMFRVPQLTELDLSSFDTAAVTNMNNMFYDDKELVTVYVSDFWNVTQVLYSGNMFHNCLSIVGGNTTPYNSQYKTKTYACVDTENTPGYLTYKSHESWVNDGVRFRSNSSINSTFLTTILAAGNIKGFAHFGGSDQEAQNIIDNGTAFRVDDQSTEHVIYAWNTGGVIYWWSDTDKVYLTGGSSSLFYNLTSITSIDLSGIDTSHMTAMAYMFYNCQKLSSITFGSGFDTSQVRTMRNMFQNCYALTNINISSFDVSNVMTMQEMFCDCNRTARITLGEFHAEKVRSMRSMFYNCRVLTSVDTGQFYAADIRDMYQMFCNCIAVPSLDLSHFSTPKLYNLQGTFQSCNAVTNITFSNAFVSDNIETMYQTFFDCQKLLSLDLSGFNSSLTNTMYRMFYRCYVMTDLAFGDNFDTSSVNDMRDWLYQCRALKNLTINGGLDSSECLYTTNMFRECSALQSLDLGSSFTASRCTDLSLMFYSCSGLLSLDVSSFDVSRSLNLSEMFESCTKVTQLDVSHFNTANAVNMSYMFYNCQALQNLDLSHFNTAKVTSMYYMFRNCYVLNNIDMSSFNTAEVSNMQHMFNSCRVMTTIDLSSFNTENVTNMSGMFYDCRNAESIIPGSNFKASRVTNMDEMFRACSKLTSLDLSNFETGHLTSVVSMFYGDTQLVILNFGEHFDTSKVVSMENMFYNCYKLTPLDLSGFNTSQVANMSCMFFNCRALTSLDLSSFDTHEVTNMVSMFSTCQNLMSLDISSFDTHEVVNMDSMFYDCEKLTSLDVSSFDTHEVTSMSSMFNSCFVLTDLDLSRFDTSEVVNMASMFNNCRALQNLDLSGDFKTGEVINMSSMFQNCYVLDELDLSSFDTREVTTMANMFYNCNKLKSLDLSNFETPKVTNMSGMFQNCYELEEADLSNFDTREVTTMSGMFQNCNSIKSLDLSSFVTPKLITMANMFSGCYELEELDVSGFDTRNVTTMSNLFSNCRKIRRLDLSNFSTPDLTVMASMFNNCYELEEVDVSNFNTSKITDMSNLFNCCYKIDNIDLRSFNTYNVTSMSSMFNNCYELKNIDLSNFYTANTVNMYYMFGNCLLLDTLDLSSFDISSINDMRGMFYNCPELVTIYVSNYWDMDSMKNRFAEIARNYDTYTYRMFWNDLKLAGGNGTSFKGNRDVDTNGNYAYIDTEEKPAYLTYKAASVNNSTDLVSTEDYCNIVRVTDSIWTYTFTGLNPNVQYYAWEEDVEDYISSNLIDSQLEVEDLKGTITNRLESYTEDEPEYGELLIRKILRAESGAELTDEDYERMFVFTITLTDEDDQPLSGTSLYGSVPFTDGVAKIRIPGGTAANLGYIPSGYHYTVTEDDTINFSKSGKGTSGVIEKNDTVFASYTNTKLAVSEKLNSFTLKKLVTGNYEIDEDFKFTISLSGLNPDKEYSVSDGNTYSTDQNGKATVDLRLNNGQEITFENLPVGSTYRITEDGGNYISSYQITDAADKEMIARDSDSNSHINEPLATATETVDEDENIIIAFTNAKDVRQNVRLKKSVLNASSNNYESFGFTAELNGISPGAVINTTVGRKTADAAGRIKFDFTVSGGDEIVFYDLPVGSSYKFTEHENEYISSYVISDSNHMGSVITERDQNIENFKELSTEAEIVNENENVTVDFVNTKVRRDITVSKTVDMSGGDLDYSEYSKQNFRYLISFTGLEGGQTYDMVYSLRNYTGFDTTDSFTASDDGTAEISFNLTHDKSVKFKNLPEGAKYTVTEYPAINYISGYLITGNTNAVISRTSDRNRKTCRILTTAEETVDDKELDINIEFTNRYYDDPTARICMVQIEKEIDTKIAAFGTPTFIFKMTNLDTGDDFMCSIVLDGNKLSGTETLQVTKGHYIAEEITVSRYSSESAEFLSGTTASDLMIDGRNAEIGTAVDKGNVFGFTLDMSEGEPDEAYLKFTNKLTNYSGVSHNSFALNRVS